MPRPPRAARPARLGRTQALPPLASLPAVAAAGAVQRVHTNRRSPGCCSPRTRIAPSADVKIFNERRFNIPYAGARGGGGSMDFPKRPLKAQGGGRQPQNREAARSLPGLCGVGKQALPVSLSRCRPRVFWEVSAPLSRCWALSPGPAALPQPGRADWRGALWARRRRSGPLPL